MSFADVVCGYLPQKKQGFFYETVAPILSVGNSSLVAISTLTSEINFYVSFCLWLHHIVFRVVVYDVLPGVVLCE